MAKQLNVNLAFTADTSQALQTLQQLKQNLHSISSLDISSAGISNELKSAVHSAQALEHHLANAFNTKTGNLDLSKLHTSLKQSGNSLATLSNNLLGAGLSGEKAFLQIQSSIASANTQLIKANGLISNFMTTLKNTARWQISSSLLHGFMGAIQSAYGYSQDLNESLNNIRIVTGQNIDQMAKFAEQANKAAKALSATTTDYTNASLIYYQQGLSDEEVQKRTDVTIKMANAAGQSAETVSDQLTAVWNNFYDGTKSLEYYADVMTALGAATASSTDEIAGGLEKFAAIGETIGLSYEYAASALATITANTRQSEDVVGTALKTIFARIQGLNLGETLDDGTTLNKYSEALQKVGISIFEQNGELKNMDNILNEMGAKWQTLGKDQQTALAQTVAGVRQYTQLVALMDNWNKGDNDSMMANLQTSYNAEGTLQEQADIYEESWEAASKRVKAALETIYAEMVPDEAFIDLMNGLEDVLNLVGMVVKGFGGLEGILMLVSSIMLTKFAPNIGQALQIGIDKTMNLKQNFSELKQNLGGKIFGSFEGMGAVLSTNVEKAANSTELLKNSMASATAQIEKGQQESLKLAANAKNTTEAFQSQVNSLRETSKLTSIIKSNSGVLTSETQQQLLNEVKNIQQLGEKRALLLEELEIIQQQNQHLADDVLDDVYGNRAYEEAGNINLSGENLSASLANGLTSLGEMALQANEVTMNIDRATGQMQLFKTGTTDVTQDFSHLDSLIASSVDQIVELTSISNQIRSISLDKTFNNAKDKAVAMTEALSKMTNLSPIVKTRIEGAVKAFSEGKINAQQLNSILRNIGTDAKNVATALGVSDKHIKQAVDNGRKLADNTKNIKIANNEYNNSLNTTTAKIEHALKRASEIGPTIAKGFSHLSSVAMSISMLSNAFDTLTDSEAPWGQKLTTTTMALSMSFGAFMNVIKGVNSALTALNSVQTISTAISANKLIVTKALTKAEAESQLAELALIASTGNLTQAQIAQILVENLGMEAKEADALAQVLLTGATEAGTAALEGHTDKEILNTVATNAGTAANYKYAASQLLKNKYMLITVAVLAVLAAGIIAVVKAEKQRIETNKKTAEGSQEAAKAAQEEADANKELIDSYYAALKAQDGAKESKDALYAAALKVAKSYGIEGAAVDALAGDYKNLTKKILEARKAELQGTKGSNDIAITTTTQTLLDALRKGKGHVSGSAYTGTFGTSEVGQDILKDGDYQFLTSNKNGKINFDISDFSNTEDVYAYYQEVEKLIAEYRAKAETDDSITLATDKVYQEALKELNEGKEAYAQLKELYGENNGILLELGTYMAKTSSGDGIIDVDSLSEYEDFYKNYIKYLADQKGITEENTEAYKALEQEALGYLSTQEHLAKYALDSQGFKDKFGDISSEDLEAIKEFYSSLSEEEKELFWQVDIDEDTSLDNIRSYIEQAQDFLDSNRLNAEIKVNNELSDLIGKESKTEEDWTAIREGFEASNYDIDYADFLKMSQKEQQAYLESHAEKLKDDQDSTLSTSVQDAEDKYNEAVKNKEYKQGTADYIAAYNRGQQAEYEAKKTNLNNKVSDYKDRWETYNTPNGGTTKYFTTDDGAISTNLDDIYNYLANNKVVDDYTLGLYKDAFDVSNKLYEAGFYQGGSNNIVNTSGEIIADYGDQTAMDYLLGKVESIAKMSGYEKDTEEYDAFVNELFALLNNQGGLDSYYAWNEFGDSLITGIESYGEKFASNYGATAETYGKSAETYEDESQKYNTAVETSYDDYIKQLQNAQDLQAEYKKEVKDAGLDLNEYEAYKDLLVDTYEELEGNEAALHKVTVANKKMEKGVKTLSSNWKDWNKIMSDGTIEDVSTILPEVNEAVQEILNLDNSDFSLLPPTFAQDNWDLIQQVVNGVEGSVDKLRDKAGESILFTVEGNVDPEGKLKEDIASLHSEIASWDAVNFDVGVEINPEDHAAFIERCNELIRAAGMTKEQTEAYFAAMGYDVKLKEISPETVTESEYSYYRLDPEATEAAGGVPQFESEPTKIPVTSTAGATAYALETITPNGSYGGGVGVETEAPTTSRKIDTGGKSSKKERKDPNKDIERYHTVTKEIEDLNRELSRIEANKEQAFGKSKLPFIQEELKTIDLLIKKNAEYQKQIKEMSDYDWSQISSYGFIDINTDGILDNWYEVQKIMMNEYNTAVEQFNKDGDEATFEAAEKRYNDFLDLVEQYEETQEALEDAIDEAAELERQRISKELEKITTEIEFEIEIDQRDLDKLDYIVDKLGRNINNMIEIIDTLGTKVSSYQSQSGWYADGINRIKANAAEEGRELTDEEQRKIWEYEDALLGINNSLMDMVETVENSVMEEFERLSDEVQKNIDRFDTYSSMLDHYNNIIKLSGRQTKDSMLLMKLSAQQTDIAMKKLNATNDKYLAQQKAQGNAATQLAVAKASGNAEDIEYWTKQYEEITKAVEQSHDEMLASWEEVLQAASDQFDLSIEITIQKLKESISAYGLDGLADRYEKAKIESEQYLSQLDKEYELNKLLRQIEGSIDDTDNLNAKRELIKLLDKVNEKTAEGVKLSQYDLEYMQAEYELELAKLALEETRNAKTTVRLQRGDDGNYSYVYTADQDEIDKAQQNYEDKLYDIRKLSEDYITEMSDLITQNELEMMEALAGIDKNRADYVEEVNRITTYYLNRDMSLRQEMDKAIENSGKVYSDTIFGQLEDAGSLENGHTQLETKVKSTTTTMISDWNTWKTQTEAAMEEVGSSSETFTQDIESDMSEIKTATTTLATDINTQTQNMITYIGNLMAKVQQWRTEYIAAINAMISANERLAGVSSDTGEEPVTTPTTSEKPVEEASTGTVDTAKASALAAEAQEIVTKVHKGQIKQGKNGWKDSARAMGYSEAAVQIALKAFNDSKAGGGYSYYYEEALKLAGSYDTGGYTGVWGPEGKLAFLHQKELVLNEADTKNLLSAVEIIRSISRQIDKQAEMAALTFAQRATSSTTFTDGQTYQVEQDVTIHAEFPNATDQNEIREAILGLVNYTAQYVAQR